MSQCRGAVDYSFRLLHAHRERGLHAVFRLLRNAHSVFRDCIRGDGRDALVTVEPGAPAQREQAGMRPWRVRLVQYNGRRSIKELYKVSKQFLEVEQFHGRSERPVKQEVFAHFSLDSAVRIIPS